MPFWGYKITSSKKVDWKQFSFISRLNNISDFLTSVFALHKSYHLWRNSHTNLCIYCLIFHKPLNKVSGCGLILKPLTTLHNWSFFNIRVIWDFQSWWLLLVSNSLDFRLVSMTTKDFTRTLWAHNLIRLELKGVRSWLHRGEKRS